jgi:hypothetical protein
VRIPEIFPTSVSGSKGLAMNESPASRYSLRMLASWAYPDMKRTRISGRDCRKLSRSSRPSMCAIAEAQPSLRPCLIGLPFVSGAPQSEEHRLSGRARQLFYLITVTRMQQRVELDAERIHARPDQGKERFSGLENHTVAGKEQGEFGGTRSCHRGRGVRHLVRPESRAPAHPQGPRTVRRACAPARPG